MPKQAPARALNAPLGQRLAQSAGSYDQAARTVEIVIATETPVKTPGYMIGCDQRYYLEILDCKAGSVDLGQVEAGNCPLLDTHNRWSLADQLGTVQDGRCEGGQVVITAALGQSDAARGLEAEITAGTPPKTSAGFSREQVVFERMDGDVPVYRVTKWTLREASFVPIAADPNAGVRSQEHVFPCVINEGARAMPQEVEKPAVVAAPEAPAAVTPPEGARAPEAPKLSRFTGSAAMAFVETARAFGDTVVTRAKELIEKNEAGEISVETANTELLKASAEAQRAVTGSVSGAGIRAEVTADERDKFLTGASNAIIQRAGLTDLFTRAAKAKGETIDLNPGEYRGVRNAELARICLERAGERISSYDRDEIVGQALTHRAGGNTTSDFAVLLENTLHKTLQAAYSVTPDTWRRFCGVGSVVDFRAHPRYLRGTFGTLDARLESGEFKNKSIPDGAKESITASSKGNIIGLTRDAIVNDDLGAFSFLAVDLGRAAMLSIESDVYALLTSNSGTGPAMNDGNTLFHASHSNIAATPAAPSVIAFDAIAVLMASQKDLSGNEYLDIRPSVLLVPIGLRGDSIVINAAQYDPDTASKLQKPNKVRGLFDDVVGTPRLSGTRYYAFADPNFAPAMEVAFLNGVQEPYLEQRQGWRFDGTEFKVRHDYGVGGVNYRSAVTNAGA